MDSDVLSKNKGGEEYNHPETLEVCLGCPPPHCYADLSDIIKQRPFIHQQVWGVIVGGQLGPQEQFGVKGLGQGLNSGRDIIMSPTYGG